MKIYKYMIFDLDGTVIKSDEGVINSVKYALSSLGEKMPDVPESYFIGPPLSYSFENFCGFKGEKITKALELYREYYTEKGIFQCKVYDGIPALLSELHKKGHILLVASSKPEVYVKQILERFDISKYFDFIGGAELDGSRNSKDDVLRYVLESAGIPRGADTMMIGDRKYDIISAGKLGMTSLGVTYGYGTREELEQAGADYIVDTPEEALELLQG